MRKSDRGLVYQDLNRLFRRGVVADGDGALLESFLSEGNEAAFEALVNRHGPMVRGVCRRLLSSPHDADDAFQATFLVLARKGGRLRDPDRLAPWLHGVATREALKARARLARMRIEPIVEVPSRQGGNAEWSDLMPIIDAEMARLPAKHRDVLIACLLDGATVEEASQRLACPVGTVKSRLARARETLRARLTSRGVAPAAALAALDATDALGFASPVSSTLIRATLNTVSTPTVAPGFAAFFKGAASAMISKPTVTSLVLAAGLGLGGLAAAWIKPSSAQVHLPSAKARAHEVPEAMTRDRNIREILLAAANYNVKNGCFPPPAIATAGSGGPHLSWRVALLPYLGQTELYEKFHLGEPWDSPHNKALIDLMPAVFETPNAPSPKGWTRIRGIAGAGSIFDPSVPTFGAAGRINRDGMMRSMMEAMKETRGNAPADPGAGGELRSEAGAGNPQVGMMSSMMMRSARAMRRPGVGHEQITDGTSNTLFLVIARDATPWTKPGELPFVPGQDLPALDESDPRGLVLGMCDGAVRTLPTANLNRLPFLITRAGGEVVDQNWFSGLVPPAAPTVPATAPTPIQETVSFVKTPPAPVSESIEQRLQRLEAKFDRLLEKLDAR